MNVGNSVLQRLLALRDTKYGTFQAALIPTVASDTVIGVRTPALRQLAKELAGTDEVKDFIACLPHTWFEENQLHAFIIAGIKDFQACLTAVGLFLPYIVNWATCDQLSPKVFSRHRDALLPHIRQWLHSLHPYTVRFAIKMLIDHFLGDAISPEYSEMVANVQRDDYYIRMMQAWYFATALAKQWDATLPYLTEARLAPWVHRKTIQKATESYRITDTRKAFLKTLR